MSAEPTTGAVLALRTARNAGIDVCFANPGTTEMPLVVALDRVGGIRPVLGLFEGVCTGAADGFARIAGRPALTLLHLGPGLANGAANLHNARRARVPILNLVGDHATWHVDADAPLTSDIEGLARPVSDWVRTSRRAAALGDDVAAALAAGGVATLVVPHDLQLAEVSATAPRATAWRPAGPDAARVEAAAALLRDAGRDALLLVGGSGLHADGQRAAARIAAATGCRLVGETFPARMAFGRHLPAIERLPYFPEHAAALLRAHRAVVCAGAREPVAFFGYPGQPSRLLDAAQPRTVLAASDDDVVAALVALADALGAPRAPVVDAGEPPTAPRGALDMHALASAVAAVVPADAVVVDEGATSSALYFGVAGRAAPHEVLSLTGGAIGQGLPCATGAALARPGRPVIALQADGSALYTPQALWTQAREGLHVVTILCANRAYRILTLELMRAGVAEPGPAAARLTTLDAPAPDWTALARGFGVPATRADDADGLVQALRRALATPGPTLIEASL
jgi:acetolactate synthase-1/2/3 large subunit